MKLKNLFSLALGVILSCGLVACGDDDNTPRTDASLDFTEMQTYVGKLEPITGAYSCDEMTVTIQKADVENAQAVTITYKGTTSTSKVMDFSYVFNVAKSGSNYVFTSAASSGSNMSYATLEGNTLKFYTKMLSSGKLGSTTASKQFLYTGEKQETAVEDVAE